MTQVCWKEESRKRKPEQRQGNICATSSVCETVARGPNGGSSRQGEGRRTGKFNSTRCLFPLTFLLWQSSQLHSALSTGSFLLLVIFRSESRCHRRVLASTFIPLLRIRPRTIKVTHSVCWMPFECAILSVFRVTRTFP